MSHSAAEIVAQLLTDLGLVSAVEASTDWPVYITSEPDGDDIPDEVVTITDTTGRVFDRTAPDGKRIGYPGFQIRVRSGKHREGYDKAEELATALDPVRYVLTTVDGTDYLIHTIMRSTDAIPLGKDIPTSNRSLFTVNGMISFRQLPPPPPTIVSAVINGPLVITLTFSEAIQYVTNSIFTMVYDSGSLQLAIQPLLPGQDASIDWTGIPPSSFRAGQQYTISYGVGTPPAQSPDGRLLVSFSDFAVTNPL